MQINYTDITQTNLWKEYTHKKSIFNVTVQEKLWGESLILALIIYIFIFLYAFILTQSFSLLTFSIAAAGTGGILIGLSFALSGLCYYFNFLDTKIAYRKYFGLIGYFMALSYAISLLFLNPDKYFYNFIDNFLTADILLGLIAMMIFTFMTVISNTYAMKKLGPQNWRLCLRLGYVAYFLLVVRAYILEKDVWLNWINTLDNLPPLRLLLSVFALSVILLRISMIISKKSKTNETPHT